MEVVQPMELVQQLTLMDWPRFKKMRAQNVL